MGVQEKERQINCNGELKEVFGTGNAMQDKERAAGGKQCQNCPAAQPQSQCRLRWQERVWLRVDLQSQFGVLVSFASLNAHNLKSATVHNLFCHAYSKT